MTLANLDEHRSWWVLIALNTVLAMAPAVRDWIRGRLDLFNPRHVILLFLWLTYAVWPAWVILAGYEKFDSITITFIDQNSRFVARALGLGAAGLLFFHVGYFFPPAAFLTGARRAAKRLSNFPAGTLRLAVPLYSAVGLLAGFLFIRSAGGWNYLKYIDEFRTTRLAGHAPLLLGIGFLVVAANLAHHRAISRRRSLVRWAVALCLGFLACLITLMCGSRHLFLLFVFSTAIAHHYRVRRFRLSPRLFVLVLGFVVVNWVYSDFRAANYQKSLTPSTWTETAWRGFFKRFVGLESLTRVQAVFEEGEAHLGLRPLWRDAMFSVVPRSVLPDKPPVLGWIGNVKFYSDVFNESDASTGSVPLGLVGDLYWIAGVPGIVVGFSLLGLAARGSYQIATSYVHSPMGLLIYGNVFVFFLFVAEDLKLHFVFTLHRLGFLLLPLGLLLLVASGLRRVSRIQIEPEGSTRPSPKIDDPTPGPKRQYD